MTYTLNHKLIVLFGLLLCSSIACNSFLRPEQPTATHSRTRILSPTEPPVDTPTFYPTNMFQPQPTPEETGEPVVSLVLYSPDNGTAYSGRQMEVVLEAIPVRLTITHKNDGSVEIVSAALTDFKVSEMQYCFSFDAPCLLDNSWIPFTLEPDSVYLGGSVKQRFGFSVDWIGPRMLWAVAQFRDAHGQLIPSFASTSSSEKPVVVSQISLQINGIWNEATPIGDQPVPVQTALAATQTAYPVTGSVLLAGGASAIGGVAGETIQVQAVFTSSSPFGDITRMRIQTSGACLTEQLRMEDATWESFTTTRTFPVLATINWIGFYVAAQYQDEEGNLSAIYCDDISVEGIPPTPVTRQLEKTWWKPTPGVPIHWHWQLSEPFEYPRDILQHITVYDLDGELTSAQTVAQLHALNPNIKVICYFDAGVYEAYRSDAERFPASVIGNADEGWEESYWLDIRRTDILLPIMSDRIERWCKDKGFDAIEPDETEVWSNDSGFPITKEQNNAYNIQIASLAHSFGLSVGLKGNTTEAPELWQYFDWSLNEECWEYEECDYLKNSFLLKDKAVFNIEYTSDPDCSTANAWHMNSAKRDQQLVGPANPDYIYQPCIPDNQSSW